MSLRETDKTDENLLSMKDLEDQLRNQTDKLEHLRLSLSEALSCSSGSSGFDFLKQINGNLKAAIADHMDCLSRLNERMETLQMDTSLFLQMSTKPRIWNAKHSNKPRHVRWPRILCNDDTHSELGWSPIRTRKNSNVASDMSCAW